MTKSLGGLAAGAKGGPVGMLRPEPQVAPLEGKVQWHLLPQL